MMTTATIGLLIAYTQERLGSFGEKAFILLLKKIFGHIENIIYFCTIERYAR